jgi:cytochrome c1
MSRRIKIVVSVSMALVLLAALLAGTALAQGPNTAPRTPFGQWGGRGWGPGGMMGGGMMGGWGYPGTGTPITIDQATEAAQRYVAAYGNPDPSTGSGQVLRLKEVMEFTYNFYAEVEEESTGIHAFELLINRYTGAVYPEMGPNMMWNTKYSPMAGMMGGWWGRPGGPMTVTPEQARQYAQQWLDSYLPGTTVGDEADAFYGYYTLHTLRNGQIAGMLSVNGYTGQVWYHTWHGNFIGMPELEG